TDSYQNLGPGGSQLPFISLAIFENQIFAAAANGIYSASLNAPNLSDFNFWRLVKPSTNSSHCLVYKGNLYLVVDGALQVYDGISYQNYTPAAGATIKALQLSAYQDANAKLLIICPEFILLESGNNNPEKVLHTYRNDAVVDKRGYLCMVDDNYGLTIDNKATGELVFIIPNGPITKTFGKMAYADSKLWVTGGSVNDRWDPLMYNGSKFFTYQNHNWFNFRESDYPLLQGMSDFIDIKKNPFGNELYVSSFGGGIIEMQGDKIIAKYDDKNSSLQRLSVVDTTYKPLLSGGMDFDNMGNLWVSNFGVNKPISVKAGNNWYSFNVGTITGGNELGWLTCDDFNNKWLLSLRDKGILVYNDNGTPANVNDDQYKMLTKEVGQGALPSNTILCVTKDLRGEMWVGSSQGLAIISNPRQIFSAKKEDFDARQIIIKVGTNFEIFLGKEQINCIKVDPANRKWIGTPNGVWLVSEDGYTVIKNFTTANAPLLSNNVMEIGIDESTGEVFFGTEKGIISYMGDASEGSKGFSNVEIFPNPVRPDFTGSVSIRGLMDNSTVKITDINGQLVYETTSNGGFASWDGKSLNGKRVSTGVYLIFAASKDGSQTHVGKLLFIN
ncbi:MAG: T9SS type A sorting domain-containing protein, partial [Bacteroidia bacterium]|nr:T9SS type A sorting domain-containing protein [Bacteroidia bacterium]